MSSSRHVMDEHADVDGTSDQLIAGIEKCVAQRVSDAYDAARNFSSTYAPDCHHCGVSLRELARRAQVLRELVLAGGIRNT